MDDVLNRWGFRPFQRHSLILLVVGILYVVIGLSMFTEVAGGSNRSVALQFALRWWSWHVWGVIFILAGLLALLSARWPHLSETWGYSVLTGLSAGWAMMYLAGMWAGNAPASNWAGAFAWGLIAFSWWAVSGLANPQHIRQLQEELLGLMEENMVLHRELSKRKEEGG